MIVTSNLEIIVSSPPVLKFHPCRWRDHRASTVGEKKRSVYKPDLSCPDPQQTDDKRSRRMSSIRDSALGGSSLRRKTVLRTRCVKRTPHSHVLYFASGQQICVQQFQQIVHIIKHKSKNVVRVLRSDF